VSILPNVHNLRGLTKIIEVFWYSLTDAPRKTNRMTNQAHLYKKIIQALKCIFNSKDSNNTHMSSYYEVLVLSIQILFTNVGLEFPPKVLYKSLSLF